MKKLLLALICALAFVMPLTVKAETVAYSLTFYENYAYNLDTGAFVATPGWSATNRLNVYEDITLSNDNYAHHILFWDKNNTYIGYGNIASSYEGSMFIGDFTSPISFPAGVARFAFTTNNLGVNAPSGLGAYSYAQVFADPLYLDYVYPLFADSLDYVYTTFNTNWLSYASANDVTILEVKNLIQYGDGSSTTGFISVGSSTSVSNGIFINTGSGSGSAPYFYKNTSFTSGLNYYVASRVRVTNSISTQLRLRLAGGLLDIIQTSPTLNTWYFLSGNANATTTGSLATSIRHSYSSTLNATNSVMEVDYIVIFDSNGYTKTQLDVAISYYGYPTYNVDYDLPDLTDPDFDTYELADLLNYVSDYTGDIDDLNIAITLDLEAMKSNYGITDYLDLVPVWELYEDAFAQVDRWEWYSDKGINFANYNVILAIYNNLTAWYSTGVVFANFDNLTVSYDRTAPIPPVEQTLLEKIEAYIDDFGLGDWAYLFIAIAIMITFAVLLGLMRAPMMVMLIVEGALFMLFTIFGWFPVWLVILVVIVLFVLLYRLIKGDPQDA